MTTKTKADTKRYPICSNLFNARLIGEYTAERLPKAGREEREKAFYEKYRAALASGGIPHGDTILKALEFMRRSRRKHLKDLARKLANRRILVLFQDKLGTSDVYARGELHAPGEARIVKTNWADGRVTDYKALSGGVIKLSTDVVDSYIATAALIAHEMWHVIERELELNGLHGPAAIPLPDGDMLSSSENWADYYAGEAVAAYGFNEGAILKPAQYTGKWGARWRETYGIIIPKFRLFRAAFERVEKRRLQSAEIWKTLRGTNRVFVAIGGALHLKWKSSSGAEHQFIGSTGIGADGRPRPDLYLLLNFLDRATIKWSGHAFSGTLRGEAGETATVQGDVDASGFWLRDLSVAYEVTAGNYRGSVVRFRLRDMPVYGYDPKVKAPFFYDVTGAEAGRHISGFKVRHKQWSEGTGGRRHLVHDRSVHKINWQDPDTVPYIRVIFTSKP